jgi:hypothetical protein
MDMRREQAKTAKDIQQKQDEMTPEELEMYIESIPEWKRGALVVTDQPIEEEVKPGVLKRMKRKIGAKISETDAA